MNKAQIVRDYMTKYKDHPKRTVARILQNDHPGLFSSCESARTYVKSLTKGNARGTAGVKQVEHKPLAKPPPALPPLPESKVKPWEPFRIDQKHILVLSDIHVPYHDKGALTTALEYGDKFQPDCILLLGDIIDFYSISRFDTNPEERDLAREICALRELLAHLGARFPKARLVYKLGNHDERWWTYLWRKAPELVGLNFTRFSDVVEAEKHRVELVDDQRLIRIGRLWALHGHEWRMGANSPVNPARTAFLKGLECSISGHLHKTSEHSETSLNDSLITTWSLGCLCELHPAYARLNKWNHGFCVVEQDDANGFSVSNLRIRHGRVL